MREITKQAVAFWKGATEIEIDKEHYEGWLKERLFIAKRQEVIAFLKGFQDEPYFKLQDILQPSTWMGMGGIVTLTFWVGEMRTALIHPLIIKEIITFLLNNYLSTGEIGTEDYLDIEKLREWLPVETLEKARRKLVLGLMRFSRQINKLHELPEDTQEKEEEIRIGTNNLVEKLSRLQRESHFLPPEFIDELVKRLGLDYYLRFGKGKILHKPTTRKLDLSEVALRVNGLMINKDNLLALMHEGDENAKNYLRGLLYVGNEGGAFGLEVMFILDSEDQPMNLEMQRISWPPTFQAHRISKERITYPRDKEYQKRLNQWSQLIIDFGNIPQ